MNDDPIQACILYAYKEGLAVADEADAELAASRLLLEECAKLLKRHEWSAGGNGLVGVCPSCGNWEDRGHKSNCEWNALLRRLSET